MLCSAKLLIKQKIYKMLLNRNVYVSTLPVQGVHELRERNFEPLLKELAHEI